MVAAELDLPYACIPAGTRNHFALDLGVDRDDVVGALDAFVDGGERQVDLAEELAFRDYLRDHPAAAREYEALKRRLASRADVAQPGFQDAYAAAKGPFVERIIGLALAAGYPRGLGTPLPP